MWRIDSVIAVVLTLLFLLPFVSFGDDLSSITIEPDGQCDALLQNLVGSINNLTKCMMTNIVTFNACFVCSEFYMDLFSVWNLAFRPNPLNASCLNQFQNVSLHFIREQSVSTLNFWKNSSCDKCFDRKSTKTGVNLTLRDDFIEFQKKRQDYQLCRDNAFKRNLKLCDNCSASYKKVIESFRSGLEASPNKKDASDKFVYCLDISAVVKEFTDEWARNNCLHIKKDDFASILISLFIILFPVVFYLGSYIGSDPPALEYELIDRASYCEAEDDDPSNGFTCSAATFVSCREDISLHAESERTWSIRGNSNVTSIGSASISSNSPRFRLYSPLSSTNNLLM